MPGKKAQSKNVTKSKAALPNSGLVGKASIKHFLNTSLKPRSPFPGKLEYPVYMRAVFNKKSTKIKSDFKYFSEESLLNKRDIFVHLRYKLLYSPGDSFLSEANFNSSQYRQNFIEESRTVSEIIQFYGRFGINILLDNPNGFITISMPYIQKVFSDYLWKSFEIEIDKDLALLLNIDRPFDEQFDALKKYGNQDIQIKLARYQNSYDMLQMLKKSENFRVYEWIYSDYKKQFLFKFDDHPEFTTALRKSISEHFRHMLLAEDKALFERIKKEI